MSVVTCQCGSRLSYTTAHIGRLVKCPECSAPIQIPNGPGGAAANVSTAPKAPVAPPPLSAPVAPKFPAFQKRPASQTPPPEEYDEVTFPEPAPPAGFAPPPHAAMATSSTTPSFSHTALGGTERKNTRKLLEWMRLLTIGITALYFINFVWYFVELTHEVWKVLGFKQILAGILIFCLGSLAGLFWYLAANAVIGAISLLCDIHEIENR